MTAMATRSSVPPAQVVDLNRPAPNAKTIMQLMESPGVKERLAVAATKHLPPDKLLRMIGVQMARVPKLGNCTPISVLDCAMTCSELGLSPGVLGDIYLIPYSNVCTVIVGYRGLLKLARRSGHISSIQAEVVREGDKFEYRFGMDAKLEHTPEADVSAKMTHAWAMAKFRDGSFQFVVMRAPEVEAIRKRSKASGNGPWVTDTGEMWKKTALRRLCKMLPLTPEIEDQIAKVDRTEFEYGELDIQPTQPGAAGIIAKLDAPAEGDQGQGDDAPSAADELKQATAAAEGCAPGKPGCSGDDADYSTVEGKRVCANHAKTAEPESTLPGMGNAGRRKR